MAKRAVLNIGNVEIAAGTRQKIQLTSAKLYTGEKISIPVEVIRAKREGPTMFISAAIHGDLDSNDKCIT